ncbi:hypothetical protein A2380_00645 [candidate division WWE3 bacterium RIFOXYB1_FULL_43_24]|uniref:Peptidase MA-like domain-containing protein n=2 Tax=Katanobacteria TaxID=422282 RepID=A0A0G0YRH7_UNCKA|nr:MAG: hypothetical protein UU92_C0005G0057 [candidate division WWE3 bacterium GW2011_GWA1_42_12]KKS33657.1 MAG: hypothetical protein UU97_C0024G0007 [candidate division WWE3 bacterium GW2011_GWD1_42_14]KKS39225.1 MAG: hypothetical protein UV00_C0003G0057 [candidate division WWE3 bacterium GW2011_GWF1_42_14]KKS40723.1 MAG: hypothetical protein UV03_C0003G0036 [candidate division WWE3 bacterium GW2011_GWE1_42_16]KKS66879.1 MAG: hypothetical protein UV35_C0006G0058 [candidate division WWE3 bacte
MIFKIQTFEDPILEKLYSQALEELKEFFQFRWEKNTPKLIVIEDRDTINAVYGKQTESWMVAWAEDTRNIFILSRENYEKYSSHKYSEDEFYKLIKHELSHMFYKLITFTDKPRWLNEGISTYISGQLDNTKPIEEFKVFLNYFDKTDAELYKESGYLVKLLLDKFGKDKLSKFTKSLKGVKDPETTAKVFQEAFGLNLSYESINYLLTK